MNSIGIDLGSNSLTITKVDCSKKEVIKSFLQTVRTAEGLAHSGIVSKDAVLRVINALNRAKKEIDFSSCKVKAVTTEALRVAKNQKEVLQEIKDKIGIEFKVISGQEEAKLTLLAVKNRLEKLGINRDFLLIDIGGGSTEVIFFINGKIISKSFDIGIVTVANMANSLEEIKAIVKDKFKSIKEFTKDIDHSKLALVATAGTPTTIAAIKLGLNYETYDASKVTGTMLNKDELEFYLNKLLQMDKKQREIAVGVGRDDLIVAGVIIYQEFYELFNKDKSIVIDDGLSMGVALSECKSF